MLHTVSIIMHTTPRLVCQPASHTVCQQDAARLVGAVVLAAPVAGPAAVMGARRKVKKEVRGAMEEAAAPHVDTTIAAADKKKVSAIEDDRNNWLVQSQVTYSHCTATVTNKIQSATMLDNKT